MGNVKKLLPISPQGEYPRTWIGWEGNVSNVQLEERHISPEIGGRAPQQKYYCKPHWIFTVVLRTPLHEHFFPSSNKKTTLFSVPAGWWKWERYQLMEFLWTTTFCIDALRLRNPTRPVSVYIIFVLERNFSWRKKRKFVLHTSAGSPIQAIFFPSEDEAITSFALKQIAHETQGSRDLIANSTTQH